MSNEEAIDDQFRSALARGDEATWFAFHQRYTERLIRYARVVAKDDELARDAVQAIMVGLVRNRNKLEHVEDLEAYLFSALRRDLWRILKQVKKESALLVPLESGREAGSGVLQLEDKKAGPLKLEDRDGLSVALSHLSVEQRVVIELRFFGALTFERIATVIELPLGTVVSRFRAGLRQLRQELGESI